MAQPTIQTVKAFHGSASEIEGKIAAHLVGMPASKIVFMNITTIGQGVTCLVVFEG